MIDLCLSSRFKKDYKKAIKRGCDPKKLEKVVNILREQKELPAIYRDHALIGDYIGFRECHLSPDWLLIYQIQNDKLVLFLSRTGTHSDLF